MSSINHLTSEQIADLKETFSIFDKDKDGVITREESKALLRSLDPTITEEALEVMSHLNGADLDGSGAIDFPEFATMMMTRGADASVRQTFVDLDRDGDGKITIDELKQLMVKLGESVTDAQINKMMRETDTDGDGHITFPEFTRMMVDAQ